jgi:Ca2+-binding RTX toxin-like protein
MPTTGNDSLAGTAGNDTIDALAGNDTIDGQTGNDSLTGDAGEDTLHGGAGADTLVGGDGADLIFAGQLFSTSGWGVNTGGFKTIGTTDADIDSISGGAGNDWISAGAGDVIDGGDGFDVLDYDLVNTTTGLTVSTVGGAPTGIPGSLANVEDVRFHFGSGADVFTGGAGADVVSGGGGADSLSGGNGNDVLGGGLGADTLLGGEGNDVLTAARITSITRVAGTGGVVSIGSNIPEAFDGAADLLDGGAGDDVIDILASEADTIIGGTGTDTGRIIARSTVSLNLNLGEDPNAAVSALTGGQVSGIERWSITGSTVGDFLVGSDGDDVLSGGIGDDILIGGIGNDSLTGGANNDVLTGGPGADLFRFTTLMDNDVVSDLNAGEGDRLQLVVGGAATPALGFTPFEDLDGDGAFDDAQLVLVGYQQSPAAVVTIGLLNTSTAPDLWVLGVQGLNGAFAGLTGNDSFDGGSGNETFRGSDGNDTLNGGAGSDELYGDAGDDLVNGGDGNDRMDLSGGGVDTVIGGAGDDWVFGKAGDTADYSAATVVITIIPDPTPILTGVTQVYGEGTDTINGVNVLLTGSANDLVQGRAIAERFNLGSGADWADGGQGNDTLEGGDGADTLSGGIGNDLVVSGTGADYVLGGAGIDTIDYRAETGNLTFNSAFSRVDIAGMAGFEVAIDFEHLWSGSGNDFITTFAQTGVRAGGGNDVVVDYSADVANTFEGEAGSDTLYGLAGNDTLNGGADNDLLFGGDGDDVITGGAGADFMGGGAGADTFRFLAVSDSTFANVDAVTAFTLGVDRIDLAAIDANTGVAGDQAFTLGALQTGVAGRLAISVVTALPASGETMHLVQGDVDGDGMADFAFLLVAGGSSAPTAADFVL